MSQEQEIPLNPVSGQEQSLQSAEDILLTFARDSLGFTETERLQLVRQQIEGLDREAEEAEDEFKRLITEYQDLSAQEIDRIQDPGLYPRAQIGLTIASAAIYHSFGRFRDYRESMGDAITYADNMGYEDVAQNLKEKQMEIFQGDFRRGFGGLLELLEVVSEEPLPPDPFAMGIDDRTFEELTEQEKLEAQKIVYEELGLQSDKLDQTKVRDYTTQADASARVPGEIRISVFRTNKEEQGIFLQELLYEDSERRWVIGPDRNI